MTDTDKTQLHRSVLATRCPLCRASAREVFADWLEEYDMHWDAGSHRWVAGLVRQEVKQSLAAGDQCPDYGYRSLCPAHQNKVKPCP